jgi:steroid delta-isomerase-like uncharacterized protein
MSLDENKTLVRRFVEEVQNQHNLDAIDELFSPAFVDHSGTAGLPGIEGTKAFFHMMITTFPDMHFTIQQQLAESDQVLTHKTFHGTHQGEFMGIPGTGKQVSFDVMDILTVRDGKITDHWTVGDFLGMLQQLGAIPNPG